MSTFIFYSRVAETLAVECVLGIDGLVRRAVDILVSHIHTKDSNSGGITTVVSVVSVVS
jgi:hypothetical protein